MKLPAAKRLEAARAVAKDPDPAGDEKAVASRPVTLNQKEPRLIEARVWVKADRLCMLQTDALNKKGERLDGCNFIHMAPNSVGTDDWRLVRQVFRPRLRGAAQPCGASQDRRPLDPCGGVRAGDPFARRGDPDFAYWFLNALNRHAKGFMGWDRALLPKALPYIPEKAVAMGPLPSAGRWLRLEVPLEKVGATDGLLDGVAFLHEGGRVWWQDTRLVDAGGKETVVWGDSLARPPEELRRTRIEVAGLKAGTKVRVLFEDRDLTAGDGFFEDGFRGQDLCQRFGGYRIGYGDEPVALHAYEIAASP